MHSLSNWFDPRRLSPQIGDTIETTLSDGRVLAMELTNENDREYARRLIADGRWTRRVEEKDQPTC